MTNGPDRFHRYSVRLKGHDYSQPEAYFVTIVTQWHKYLFGEIIDKELYLNDLGKIVSDCWQEILNHFTGIEVEPYVVIQNHIHGVITIIGHTRRGTIYRAPTTMEIFIQPVPGSIPTIVRTYKAVVSRLVKRDLGMVNIWQRNYYEHSIRNQLELNDIDKYIYANPENWSSDLENHKRLLSCAQEA